MKKILVMMLVLAMMFSFVACGAPAEEEMAKEEPAKEEVAKEEPAEEVAEEAGPIYIPVISKGFQHQFWQTVKSGSDAAAADLGVEITFDGPPTESDIAIQVDMLNAAMAKNPAALCLAALDTESVTEQLQACLDSGIPVIGFDSGCPNAPEGSIVSTASTDNAAAGGVGAENMYMAPSVKAAIEGATPDAPVVVAVISQDATSGSVTGRTNGFVDKMAELCEAAQPGLVSITGHDKWAKPVDGAAVEILVTIAASTSPNDCQTAAQAVLQRDAVGIFCTNSGTVDGLLAATTDGTDLMDGGKYGDLVAVGFDAGATLKNAVREEWFYGAITQDPYMIGYLAVELAVKAINGESVDVMVDTGAKFYNSENMDDEGIANLLYD